MRRHIYILLLVCISLAISPANAEQVTKEQTKGIDEQVQDIKKDVLGISAELNLLEEKLLFPSNTQIAIFVSLDDSSSFVPSAIKLKVDDKDVADHIYSFKEVEAMKRGGVQRVYTGNVLTGDHSMKVSVIGKSGGGNTTDTGSYSVKKGVGPKFVEVRLTGSGVKFRDW